MCRHNGLGNVKCNTCWYNTGFSEGYFNKMLEHKILDLEDLKNYNQGISAGKEYKHRRVGVVFKLHSALVGNV